MNDFDEDSFDHAQDLCKHLLERKNMITLRAMKKIPKGSEILTRYVVKYQRV
jgi:hypothetical protein